MQLCLSLQLCNRLKTLTSDDNHTEGFGLRVQVFLFRVILSVSGRNLQLNAMTKS